jgi:pseudoazurin
MMSKNKMLFLVANVLMTAAFACQAETIVVKGQGISFAPSVIKAQVGDIIAFKEMAGHFVDPVTNLWPEGAEKMHSEMGADYNYEVKKEGLYVFKCPPHWGARMGAVMLVGNPADLSATLDKYFSIAETEADAKPAKGLLKKFKETLAK